MELDADIAHTLDDLQSLCEKYHTMQMVSEQLIALNTDAQKEITSLKEKLARTSSEEKNWKKLADSLKKTVTIVSNRTDNEHYEQQIAKLRAENENLLTEVEDVRTTCELKISEIEYKSETKLKLTKSSLETQIEALKITKHLVQTEVDEKYDELESKFQQTVQENKIKYNDMMLHYEKRLQNVRCENAGLEKENVQLIRDKENLKAEVHKLNLNLNYQKEVQMMKTDLFTYSLVNDDPIVQTTVEATETEAYESGPSTASVNVDEDQFYELESSLSTHTKKSTKRKLYTRPNYYASDDE